MFKKDSFKKINKLFSSRGSDPSKLEIAPFRDWRIIIMSFFVGFIVSVGFGVYMSIKINRDSFFVVEQKETSTVILNRDSLTKALGELSEKEIFFNKVVSEGVKVVDPSL